MEYNYPQDAANPVDPQSAAQPPQQQPQSTGARGRGRRQYAAQQYDFNAPGPAPSYDQQAHYVAQGFQQAQPGVAGTQLQQYGQPPVQYGQEYQAPGSNTYQQGYQGQPNVTGMTNQLQQMHVSQVAPSPFLLTHSLLR